MGHVEVWQVVSEVWFTARDTDIESVITGDQHHQNADDYCYLTWSAR